MRESRFCPDQTEETFNDRPYNNSVLAPYENPILRTINPDALKAFVLEPEKEETIIFLNALRIHLNLTAKPAQLLNTEYHLAVE